MSMLWLLSLLGGAESSAPYGVETNLGDATMMNKPRALYLSVLSSPRKPMTTQKRRVYVVEMGISQNERHQY